MARAPSGVLRVLAIAISLGRLDWQRCVRERAELGHGKQRLGPDTRGRRGQVCSLRGGRIVAVAPAPARRARSAMRETVELERVRGRLNLRRGLPVHVVIQARERADRARVGGCCSVVDVPPVGGPFTSPARAPFAHTPMTTAGQTTARRLLPIDGCLPFPAVDACRRMQ